MTRVSPAVPSDGARPPRPRRAIGHLARLAVLIGAIAFPACIDEGAVEHRVVGNIPFGVFAELGFLPQIPDTVTATVPMQITFWTAGSASCILFDDTEVVGSGRSVGVIPYDIVVTRPNGCFTILDFLEHKATVVFEEPGTAEIVLVYSTQGSYWPEEYTADGRKVYTVEVVPAGSG